MHKIYQVIFIIIHNSFTEVGIEKFSFWTFFANIQTFAHQTQSLGTFGLSWCICICICNDTGYISNQVRH